jgi:uncharacterized membrane protein
MDPRHPKHRTTTVWLIICSALFAFSVLAFLGAFLAREGSVEGVFPWQLAKLRHLLVLSGVWLAFVGIVVLVSYLQRNHLITHVANPNGTPADRKRRWTFTVLVLLVVGYSLAYGWLSSERHSRFNSTGYDLAIKEQVIWNTAHGRFFASSPEVDYAFADHFQPLMLALIPFYVPVPSPEVLLWVQTIGLALGAVPLYRLAERRLKSTSVALVLSTAYLLFPALGFMNRFDFHPEVLAVTAFLFAFEALDRGNLLATSVWLLVPLLGKENLGFSVAVFGLYAALVLRRVRFGVFWFVAGVAVSSLTMFWLIPTLREGPSDTLARYGWLGDTPAQILSTLITRPGYIWSNLAEPNRGLYLLQLLAPTGFLALLALPELLLAAPGLIINFLAEHHCQPEIYCQYTVPITPFVFIAAVVGLQRLAAFLNRRRNWTIIGLAILPMVMLALVVDNPFSEKQEVPAPLAALPNAQAVRRALATVPPAASVVTTNAYAPHLAQREGLYIIGIPAQRDPPAEPDIVFINLYDQRFMVCDQFHEYFSQLDIDRYGILFRDGGVVVIQRDGGSNEAFRDFVLNWTDCAG